MVRKLAYLIAHSGTMTAVLPLRTTPGSTRPGLSLRTVLRRVAEAVATPVLPDDYLDLIAPMRAGADLRGRVVSVTPETRDAATVRIKPGRSWAGHVPGQYIRIGVDVDGVRNWRAYSLTSPVAATRRDHLDHASRRSRTARSATTSCAPCSPAP